MYIFCPYRICPLGAHVDHQKGKVLGFTIDKGIHFTFKKNRSSKVVLSSQDFEKKVEFDILSFLEIEDDWGNYMRGITKLLREKYTLKYGLIGTFKGDIPIGGLSSSSAVSLAYLKALIYVNDINLSDEEMIDFAYRSETEFIGLQIGILDPSCEVLCKKDECLYLDTNTKLFYNVPQKKNKESFEILIIHSGVSRNLVNTLYNTRVDECKSAAFLIKALNNLSYSTLKNTYLSDIKEELFQKSKNRLPENWRKRAEHFYTENKRVENGINFWRLGQISKFGKLIKESCESSIKLYEVGSENLITLNKIINDLNGVYGGRFMGGGFNGCYLALINPSKKDQIITAIKSKYLSIYPNLKNKFSIHNCLLSDGIGEVQEECK